MRIADVCTREAVTIHSNASIREAAERMRQRHVGALVVIESDGGHAPVGMLTDRDIVVEVVAARCDPDTLSVADVMSRELATCPDDGELSDAIDIMRTRGVRRLPVVDAQGAIAGVLAVDDIYGAMGSELRDLGHALVREQLQEMQART